MCNSLRQKTEGPTCAASPRFQEQVLPLRQAQGEVFGSRLRRLQNASSLERSQVKRLRASPICVASPPHQELRNVYKDVTLKRCGSKRQKKKKACLRRPSRVEG